MRALPQKQINIFFKNQLFLYECSMPLVVSLGQLKRSDGDRIYKMKRQNPDF